MDELSQGNRVRVPVAVGFAERGPVFVVGVPSADGLERVQPEGCDHAGYAWSQMLALRCGRCGAPMVLPSRMIAHRSVDEIREMERAWLRAGAPEFEHVVEETADGRVIRVQWTFDAVDPENAVMVEHPLFGHMGGLPMRRLPAPRADELDG